MAGLKSHPKSIIYRAIYKPWQTDKIVTGYYPYDTPAPYESAAGSHYQLTVFGGARRHKDKDGKVYPFLLPVHHQRNIVHADSVGIISKENYPHKYDEYESIISEITVKSAPYGDNYYIRTISTVLTDGLGLNVPHGWMNQISLLSLGEGYVESGKEAFTLYLDYDGYRRPSTAEATPPAKGASATYVVGRLAAQKAVKLGFSDALMLSDAGLITDASVANVLFLDDEGVIYTPRLRGQALNGITIQYLLMLAKERRYKVVERAISENDLKSFKSCYLTGTASGLVKVDSIVSSKGTKYSFRETDPGNVLEDLFKASIKEHKTFPVENFAMF